jgi:hypothetical protein
MNKGGINYDKKYKEDLMGPDFFNNFIYSHFPCPGTPGPEARTQRYGGIDESDSQGKV